MHQPVRYLMMFRTEYMRRPLNVSRLSAFGMQVQSWLLKMFRTVFIHWRTIFVRTESDIKRLVWSEHEPYIPRPLISMHVRIGDKACEIAVAARLGQRFPSLRNICLSTETQEVVDRAE